MAVLDRSVSTARQVPYVTAGMTPFWGTVNVPTTAIDSNDDQILLFQFPTNTYLRNVAGSVNFHAGTHDTGGGSAAWVADLGIGGSDGVLDFTLVTEDDDGESSQISTQGAWIDIGGLYLILDTTTAANTAAAADFEFGGEFSASVRELVDDGVS